jgi:hypothetical protein
MNTRSVPPVLALAAEPWEFKKPTMDQTANPDTKLTQELVKAMMQLSMMIGFLIGL